jgi:hypothetical protein
MSESQSSMPHAIAPVTKQELAIKKTLSGQRLSTFEQATSVLPKERGALALYLWNAQVAATMLGGVILTCVTPLHVCEVAIRNAVSDAISNEYGPHWPWESAFLGSLPNSGKWNMRQHLASLSSAVPRAAINTGKLVPELNLVFWEKMFTARFDARIWTPHLFSVLPNVPRNLTAHRVRGILSKELEKIRRLRNRIAHHEPIISRNLSADLRSLVNLVGFRCADTAAWLVANQHASRLIGKRPM